MVAAPNLTPRAVDPMAAVRALNRMRRAGFTLQVRDTRLIVTPASQLTDAQRAYLLAHKAALVQLLIDAETVWKALQAAGGAGLGWHKGTPQDWPDARLLAAGEALYHDGRMVNRLDRRYATEHAPAAIQTTEHVITADPPDKTGQPNIPSEPPPDIAPGSIEARTAELLAEGWAPANARAKARSEAEWKNREVSP